MDGNFGVTEAHFNLSRVDGKSDVCLVLNQNGGEVTFSTFISAETDCGSTASGVTCRLHGVKVNERGAGSEVIGARSFLTFYPCQYVVTAIPAHTNASDKCCLNRYAATRSLFLWISQETSAEAAHWAKKKGSPIFEQL